MKINKLLSILMMYVIMLCIVVSFSSCDKDDENRKNKSDVWYADLRSINEVSISKSNFNEIEKAIDNNELLGKTYVTSGRYIYYYAERSLFVFSDGSFGTFGTTPGQKLGRLAGTVNGSLHAVRLSDSNTLVSCQFSLFVDEDIKSTSYSIKYATVFNGHIFKSVSVYVNEIYYTYIRNDNKIIVSNGDIYTVTSNGLIKDGSSSIMQSFDPKDVFSN